MLKRLLLVALMVVVVLPAHGEEETVAKRKKRKRQTTVVTQPVRRHVVYRDVAAEAPVHQWLASAGVGLTISPTLFLISPQLEYVVQPHFNFGPLVQVGLGGATLFTVSASGRLILGHDPKIKPNLEGDLGMAFASSVGSGSVGVHIGVGIGVDYQIESGIAVGTLIRANFMPPLKDFMLSWPIVVGRFAI